MIKFDKENARFNFRSVAVVIHEGHLLIHKAVADDFWALPGGRVEFFENSDLTVTREIEEELGLQSQIVRPLWYIENFFRYCGIKYHEISTYYLTKLAGNLDINADYEFEGIEGDTDLIFKWVALSRVNEINFKPEFLKLKLLDIPSSVEFIKINELSA